MTQSHSNSKTCGSCFSHKLADQFHRRAASLDGLSARCKSCQSVYDRERANNPARVAARLAYAETSHGRAASVQSKAAWFKRNPRKRAAYVTVSNALRSGALIKPTTCEMCCDRGRLEAHHTDYYKPLCVRWLCVACHKAEHRGEASRVQVQLFEGAIHG